MEQDSTLLDLFLYLSYFLVAVSILAAVVLPLIKSLDQPQSLLRIGGGLLLLVVIFGISYALSSSSAIPGVTGITEQGSKLIGATLITMYILLAIAILGIAVTEVTKYFR